MVIKLKNFSFGKHVKEAIFILIIISFVLMMLQLQLGSQKKIDPECLIEPEFYQSKAFSREVEDAMRQVSLIAFRREELETVPFYYYFKSGSLEYSNKGETDRAFYEKFNRAFFYMEEGAWRDGMDNYRKADFGYELFKNKTVAYIAYTDYYLEVRQRQWDRDRKLLMPYAVVFCISALLGLTGMIAFLIEAGRESQEKEHNIISEKIYTDVLLLALGLVVWWYTAGMADILGKDIRIGLKMDLFGMDFIEIFSADNGTIAIFIVVVTALAGIVFLVLLRALLRKWKAKKFIHDSFLYRLLSKLCKMMVVSFQYLCYGDLFHQSSYAMNLYYRQVCFMILTIANTSLTAYFVIRSSWWAILPFAVEILVFAWYTIGNKRIYDIIDREIKERTEEQIKSERMKIELVTNVSHDLKTPITSIISFIDLLSKEELSEAGKDYIRILQEKSERLNKIVTDLFDLAKSTSGDVTLNPERIDLGKLIRQTLADMEDRIAASGLSLKTVLPEDPSYIHADGNKLYRVFQNIIDNALKYSMAGTRVYVELSLLEGRAMASVKNIAGYDMTFTPQEILQRFARGDRARTSEGSGLGLSIAESYTKLCGGDFQVDLEGDMFKVFISFTEAKVINQDN